MLTIVSGFFAWSIYFSYLDADDNTVTVYMIKES